MRNRLVIGKIGAILLLVAIFGGSLGHAQQLESTAAQAIVQDPATAFRKVKDLIIYRDQRFYASFPSVVRKADGTVLVAFRRAPDRRLFGEKGNLHVDPNSYLVTVESEDGETWSETPKLLYAHPFGGSQDPCLIQLRSGTLLCASYGWAFVRPDGLATMKKPFLQTGPATFLGGYLLRSEDGGSSWGDPVYPPNISAEIYFNAYGDPLPAYNRGALFESRAGRLFWAVAATDTPGKTSVHLITSDDEGRSWQYRAPVARDDSVGFNETSIYETPKGDIVAFLRTANFGDQACIARSIDGGKTFGKWQSMGFRGHPLNALRLPDNRVLLTYGYRHKPYGIRARILNAECTDFETAPEIVLRDDGGNGDIGYPWPVQLDENRVLVVYYFNQEDGTRYIAGTILEVPLEKRR